MAQVNRRARSPKQGRWRSYALSIILHSGIVAAAVYGWFTWKHRPPPVTTMAIEATVVDERALKGVAPAPKPEPPPPEPAPEPEPEPPPEEQGPPKPDPAEVERKQEEERLAQEKLEQEKREQEEQAKEQQRLEAEKQAAAEKKAQEKKKAEEAAAAKKAAEEKARLAREAELRRAMEAEERGDALRNSDEARRWNDLIAAKIANNWNRPSTAQPGVTCLVLVSQVPGGDVNSVKVESCSIDDAALRESVEAAVYRASPLPPPPNPALFQRNLRIEFAPK